MNKSAEADGFTIVELLLVVVVIGILAALVITTYTGIQARTRNSKRETDIQEIQTQLEAYYQTAGNYPSRTNMNDQAAGGFVAANMKGLDVMALQDPQGANSQLGSVAAQRLYAYQPLTAAGASCESDATACVSYTLTATLENSGGSYSKKSLN